MKPLILQGGEDINPKFYGEKPHEFAGPFNDKRDKTELFQVAEAVVKNQPVIGICRGAQLLCIANGGTLWQHSIGHRGNSHGIQTKDGLYIEYAAADHHQIMRPMGKFEVLAWDDTPTHVYNPDGDVFVLARVPEIVWWPENKHLAIQPHPEWHHKKDDVFIVYLNKLLKVLEIDHEF